jgi:protease-4
MLTSMTRTRVALGGFVILLMCSWALSAQGITRTRWVKRPASTSATTTSAPASVPADQDQTPGATMPASSAATKPAEKPKLALIKISGAILESPPDFSLFDDGSEYMLMRDWLQRLAKARTDDSIKAVALEIQSPAISWSQAQELSSAIKLIGQKKPVYVYITAPSASQYLIATSARQIAMEPSGEIMITGLAAEMVYFRGTLGLLGIEPQMIQIGKFKGAAEPMACSQPSDEVKEMYSWILDDLYAQLCQQIASDRGLSIEEVKKAIDEGPLTAESARGAKFVDCLIGRLDWQEQVAKQVCADGKVEWVEGYGKKARPGMDLSNPFALLSMILKGKGAQEIKDPSIAIICGDGTITTGRSGESMFGDKILGARTLVDAFETVRKDARIKAVVFRINSPGGSALASEQIYQAVRKCADAKPVIVSISQVGASGGYYIAVGGSTILADGASIVGSIGVISGKLATTGLMDKIGVSTYEMTRGANAGLNLSRPWNKRELAVMQRMAQEIYDLFVSRVSESRGKKIKDIQAVAQGRIFTASQAAENGLIDRVGGLRDALLAAQDAAKLQDGFGIITLPRPRGLLSVLSGQNDDGDDAATQTHPGIASLLRGSSMDLEIMKKILSSKGPGGFASQAVGVKYLLGVAELMIQEPSLVAMPYYLSVSN